MRLFLIGVTLSLMLAVTGASAAAAPSCTVGGTIVYCDSFGHGHTLAQLQSYCSASRPGSANYRFYDCDHWLSQP